MPRGDLQRLGIEISTSELKWSVIRDRAGLDGLFDAWSELHRESGTRNPFTHPAWVGAWFDYFVRSEDVRVVTAHEGDRLVAVAPFHRRTSRISSPFPGTCLRLAGIGASEVLTELPEVLIGHAQPR